MDRYRGGAAALRAALATATDEQLDQPAGDGEWTARQVAHHVAESEANAFVRLRRLVAEDAPLILGYDEELYARRNHYDRPIASALAGSVPVSRSIASSCSTAPHSPWMRVHSAFP